LTKESNSEDERKENESKKVMVTKDEATAIAIRKGVNIQQIDLFCETNTVSKTSSQYSYSRRMPQMQVFRSISWCHESADLISVAEGK
jgi:hypothetical protein